MAKAAQRRCTQCFKTADKLTVRERMRWAETRTDICPRCIARWGYEEVKPAKYAERSRECGGCGKNRKKLIDGLCVMCIENGTIEAPQLFDDKGNPSWS